MQYGRYSQKTVEKMIYYRLTAIRINTSFVRTDKKLGKDTRRRK